MLQTRIIDSITGRAGQIQGGKWLSTEEAFPPTSGTKNRRTTVHTVTLADRIMELQAYDDDVVILIKEESEKVI